MNLHITQKLKLFLLIVGFSLLLTAGSQVIASTSNIPVNNLPLAFLDVNDTDGDGLNNSLEDDLGTDPMDKYGDEDGDGLYDFEEILDIYGTPNNKLDDPRYQFNDSTTHGSILDIYHYFNLTSNKTAFMRDEEFSEKNGGFNDTLLWNVTFTGTAAGGSVSGDVHYINNSIVDSVFSGLYSGGGSAIGGDVHYINNSIIDSMFSGLYSGGSVRGSTQYKGNIVTNTIYGALLAGGSRSGNTTYDSNILTNVIFSGKEAGGSTAKSVLYVNNTLNYVDFVGLRTGGSEGEKGSILRVDYVNNTLNYVNFAGEEAGGSYYGEVSYTNNTISYTNFSGDYSGGSNEGKVSYANNSIKHTLFDGTWSGGIHNGSLRYSNNLFENVTFSGDSAGGGTRSAVLEYSDNRFHNVTFSGDSAGGSSAGGRVIYTGNNFSMVNFSGFSSGFGKGETNYTNNQFEDVRYTDADGRIFKNTNFTSENNNIISDPYDSDGDDLSDAEELFNYETNPSVNDTDGDGLYDGWEVKYREIEGIDPIIRAEESELLSEEDEDEDGLNRAMESKAGTNPMLNDTDGDGLIDGWEVKYSGAAGVDPLTEANSSELESDLDNDSLTLFEEFLEGTNPSSNDTDNDSLSDTWEVRYSEKVGIDPLVEVNDSVLRSDLDSDRLDLWDEYLIGTNPFDVDTDSDGMADGWEVKYSGIAGVDPLTEADSSELESDLDTDGLTLLEESVAGTDPLSSDSDSDDLSDSWEFLYSEYLGIDPLISVADSVLRSDLDSDGLALWDEYRIGTNPFVNDTDGDGLNDGWEDTYEGLSGVNPLVKASSLELTSNDDDDGLSLKEEALARTNPIRNDTDGDGLNDGWEVRYNDSYGVNPLIKATDEELLSDRDGDGLNLLQEAIGNTDPETADNTEMSEATVGQSITDYYFVIFVGITAVVAFVILFVVIAFIIRFRRRRKKASRRKRRG